MNKAHGALGSAERQCKHSQPGTWLVYNQRGVAVPGGGGGTPASQPASPADRPGAAGRPTNEQMAPAPAADGLMEIVSGLIVKITGASRTTGDSSPQSTCQPST